MKLPFLALLAVTLFASPALSQDVTARLKALEAKVTALEGAKAVEAKPAAVQYQQVCENGVCRVVPVNGSCQGSLDNSNQGGCANGQCGQSGHREPVRRVIGFFRRR